MLAKLAAMPDAKRWFVALSGGADSTALLHVLAEMAPTYQASITALIVDHGLRDEATAEAELVKSYCDSHALHAEILTITQDRPKTGIQEWARNARYDVLCRTVREKGGILWLGHHYDDQLETVAMRLAHHSGLRGLSGMADFTIRQSVPLLRPFLTVPKSELQAYCELKGLPIITDPSNDNRHFERVRYRQMLAHHNKYASYIGRLKEAASAIHNAISQYRDDFIATYIQDHDGLYCTMDAQAFDNLPHQLKLAVLSYLLPLVGGVDYPPSHAALEIGLAQLAQQRQVTLSHVILQKKTQKNKGYWLILPEAGRGDGALVIAAGDEVVFEGRFLVRSRKTGVLRRITESELSALDQKNEFRNYVMSLPKQMRAIFPVLVTLDDLLHTPHINGMVKTGYFKQIGWPDDGVTLYPLGQLAYLGRAITKQNAGLS